MKNLSQPPSKTPLLAGDVVAWSSSFAVHAVSIVLLGLASFTLPGDANWVVSYEPIETVEEETLPELFVSAEEQQEDLGALGQSAEDSARAAGMVIDDQSLVVFNTPAVAELGELTSVDIDSPLMQAPELAEQLPVQGAGSVGTAGAVGAVDRLTHEILVSLEQEKTLVVWLFDQSGSLRDERAAILTKFDRIYEELGAIEAANNPAFAKQEDKPLLTAVVGFGAEPRPLTRKPTDQLDEIRAAVDAIEDDATGRENVFRAVAWAAAQYRDYRQDRNGNRNVMLVVFTDEAGNDFARLDDTVDLCRKLGMPVYVVGRPAPFGREKAYVKWVDPDPNFDQRPQWVPVRLGPESLLPERLKLHFIGTGQRDDLLDSGFGPFALTRLCYETGGLYFCAHPNRSVGRYVTGGETNRLAAHFTAFFDPEVMRRYQPEYVSLSQYRDRVKQNAAKQALVEAAALSWSVPLEDMRLRFPKRNEARLAEILTAAQRAAAVLEPELNRICHVILRGEAARADLRSPRWEAGYDLAVGRALAAKVRTEGYNAMLAHAKQGLQFADPGHNTWVLATANTFANSRLEQLAVDAAGYLQRVVDEHPDTPWALLAARELKEPLGWRWREDYTYLPPEQQTAGNMQPRPRNDQIPQRPPRRDPPPL